MKKRTKKKTGLVAILLILVLLISIGYATISTNLSIGGNATITAQNWLIYFTNIQPTTGSVTPTTAPTTNGTSTTTLTWVVSLDTPGQFYEYTVDVVNDGSIDAMIGTLSNSTLTTAQAKYLDYTVTYSDGAAIEQYDKLDAGDTETLRVRVEFKADPEELPSSSSAITLNYASNYVQADTTHAKARTVISSGPTAQSLAQAGTIQVGDYVNYSPASGSVTVTSAETGTANSQTFTTAGNSTMQWRVLSVNSTTGDVTLMGTPSTQTLKLIGQTGFAYGVQTLNKIAAIFGTGVGAKTGTARSITRDDVATAIGYDYTQASGYGTARQYTSGNLFTETQTGYSTTTTTATAQNPITLHDGIGFNAAGEATTIINGLSGDAKTEKETVFDVLFGNDEYEYWCASQFARNSGWNNRVFFALNYVYPSHTYDYEDDEPLQFWTYAWRTDMGDYMENDEGEFAPSVVPIIELDPTVQMEKTNNVWEFITE